MVRHWQSIEAGDYARAYDRFAPELQGENARARWIAAIERDGLSRSRSRSSRRALGHAATARVVRLRTNASRTGCNVWSGTYELRKVGGTWRISKAGLERSEC